MKVSVQEINPANAKVMLLKNRKNRKTRTKLVNFLAKQMKDGAWKENGEAIIFDVNGDLKDGQHRLEAIVKSGKKFNFNVVTDVNPNVMDTIDTGASRGLNDILELNSIKNSTSIAAITRRIMKYQRGGKGTSRDGNKVYHTTNSLGLAFVEENHGVLQDFHKFCSAIYVRGSVFPRTDLAFYLYIVNGMKKIGSLQYDFIKSLSGLNRKEGTSTSYICRMVEQARISQTTLNKEWILALIIKAWNNYVQGDPKIMYLKHNLEHPMPEVVKIN